MIECQFFVKMLEIFNGLFMVIDFFGKKGVFVLKVIDDSKYIMLRLVN